MWSTRDTHTHEAVFGQEGERLGLVALNRHARGIDKAERCIRERGHVCKAVDGIVGADRGDIGEVHLS